MGSGSLQRGPSPRKESVQRHVLRLLLHLHHRVAPSTLDALRKALEPTGQVRAPALSLRACTPRGGVPSAPGACRTATCFPPQSGEAVKELYSQLGERLEQLEHRKPSPAQATETQALELPLPAVSAPAGLGGFPGAAQDRAGPLAGL